MNLRYIFGVVLVLVLGIIYYKYNPQMYHFFPACPVHKYLGIDCPGCGSQRAMHALLHGQIAKAAGFNLLLVASLPFLLIHFSYKISSLITKKPKQWSLWYHPRTPKIIFVLVLSYWVLRNIPIYPLTCLAA